MGSGFNFITRRHSYSSNLESDEENDGVFDLMIAPSRSNLDFNIAGQSMASPQQGYNNLSPGSPRRSRFQLLSQSEHNIRISTIFTKLANRRDDIEEPSRSFQVPSFSLNEAQFPMIDLEAGEFESDIEPDAPIPELEKKTLQVEQIKDMKLDCSICLNEIKSSNGVFEVPNIICDHKFHFVCLRNWVNKKKRTCPNCRKDLFIEMDNVLDDIDM